MIALFTLTPPSTRRSVDCRKQGSNPASAAVRITGLQLACAALIHGVLPVKAIVLPSAYAPQPGMGTFRGACAAPDTRLHSPASRLDHLFQDWSESGRRFNVRMRR
jgi:hypothetical protein